LFFFGERAASISTRCDGANEKWQRRPCRWPIPAIVDKLPANLPPLIISKFTEANIEITICEANQLAMQMMHVFHDDIALHKKRIPTYIHLIGQIERSGRSRKRFERYQERPWQAGPERSVTSPQPGRDVNMEFEASALLLPALLRWG
jgi:hypothetical protein